MSADILSGLLAANIAASLGILLVVLIRKWARQTIGARLAYWLWLIPVLAGIAALLPERAAGTLPAPVAPIQPFAEATVSFAISWAQPEAIPAARASFDFALLLVIVWTAGALAFLALMLLRQQRALRAMKLAPNGTGEAPLRAAGNCGPAVVGVLRPVLVVPADFEQRFSPAERALVLAHEDVHLAANHTRINAVLVALASLNWFNPLVHWAARLARDDQELSCDAAVLERFPRERGVYAEALLRTQISSTPLPLGCTWPSRSTSFFKERLTMLAKKTPSRARRMAGAAFIAATLLGAGFVAWAQKPPVLPALPVLAMSPVLPAPEQPAPEQPAPEQAASPALTPSAPPAPVQPAPPAARTPAIVTVDKAGHVTWNNKAVDTKEALTEAARNQVASGAPAIQLSAEPATPYHLVGRVFQDAQSSGIMATRFMPSGVVINTPLPPGPGSNVPAPPRIGSPAAAPATPTGIPDPIRVFVDFDGGIFYNGVFVGAAASDPGRYIGASATLAALEQNLKGDARQKNPPEIHIEPHRLSSYAAVEQVIAAASKAGLTKIGVIGGT